MNKQQVVEKYVFSTAWDMYCVCSSFSVNGRSVLVEIPAGQQDHVT